MQQRDPDFREYIRRLAGRRTNDQIAREIEHLSDRVAALEWALLRLVERVETAPEPESTS